MKIRRLAPLVIVLALCSACAIRKNMNNLDSETVWRLNTASQLQQLESDYRQLFTDVGAAQKQGILTGQEVGELNLIGGKLKPAIEAANAEFKAYAAQPSADKKGQVIALVLTAEQIFLDLSTKKASMMTGGH